MTTSPMQYERRGAERFDFNLPVSIRSTMGEEERRALTQNVSGRGLFLLSDSVFPEGAQVEVTFCMPAEITLTEVMRVCCRGRVLRVSSPADTGKFGMAISLETYSYLPSGEENVASSSLERIACLHRHDEPASQSQSGALK